MSWDPTVFRDIWADDLRLLIDRVDVTYFRGALSQIGGYQLQEPYAFGPADFAFPQVTQFEVDRFGTGTLSWLRMGARAELVEMSGSTYGDRVWAGLITSISIGADGTAIACDGDVSGRLALRDKQPPIFTHQKDIGLMCYDALLHCGVSMTPYLGPKTGLERSNLGGGNSFLDWVDELLAGALTEDGSQWTIARSGRRYIMRLKDFTTINATVFLGAEGVTLDVARSLQEEPTTIFGTGTDPTGQKITNPRAPNLIAGAPAAYPFPDNRAFGLGTTDAMTTPPGGVYAMHRKLVGQGFMTRAEGAAGIYDDDTVDAVRALEHRANFTVTGIMNPTTWKALYNITVTGRHLYGAFVLPMAELDEVQRYYRTANGSVDVANTNFNASRPHVDQTIDHGGGVWKKDMLRFSRRHLNRIHASKNWVGTLELNGADLFAGDVTYSTANPVPISRLDVREGWNVKVVGFDGSTTFHVAGVNVGGDRNIKMAVDTRFRDLLTLGQIIARNAESRRHPAREFINTIRRPNAMSTMVVSNELFGILDGDVPLLGSKWNKIPVVSGQYGSVNRVRIHLRNSKAAFVMAVLDKNISVKHMAAVAGSNPMRLGSDAVPAVADDPSTPINEAQEAVAAIPGSKWSKEHVQNRLKHDYLCLYSAGQASQPLGYYPRPHRNENNQVTDAPITGDWEDDAGFEFYTLGGGVLYIYIFPDRDCVLQAGKLFYVSQGEGS